ncbi:uncharacterized protein LOC124138507 [Haliotis rufescens]|uniref:uncharacterized protein LOC124138507 n=1 Tax=Haliotis rufescens TaxID=6454 RepID=UPI00201EDD92|nr:uncharacterized protein LOC124138507 [Haliotis rufescens]
MVEDKHILTCMGNWTLIPQFHSHALSIHLLAINSGAIVAIYPHTSILVVSYMCHIPTCLLQTVNQYLPTLLLMDNTQCHSSAIVAIYPHTSILVVSYMCHIPTCLLQTVNQYLPTLLMMDNTQCHSSAIVAIYLHTSILVVSNMCHILTIACPLKTVNQDLPTQLMMDNTKHQLKIRDIIELIEAKWITTLKHRCSLILKCPNQFMPIFLVNNIQCHSSAIVTMYLHTSILVVLNMCHILTIACPPQTVNQDLPSQLMMDKIQHQWKINDMVELMEASCTQTNKTSCILIFQCHNQGMSFPTVDILQCPNQGMSFKAVDILQCPNQGMSFIAVDILQCPNQGMSFPTVVIYQCHNQGMAFPTVDPFQCHNQGMAFPTVDPFQCHNQGMAFPTVDKIQHQWKIKNMMERVEANCTQTYKNSCILILQCHNQGMSFPTVDSFQCPNQGMSFPTVDTIQCPNQGMSIFLMVDNIQCHSSAIVTMHSHTSILMVSNMCHILTIVCPRQTVNQDLAHPSILG